MKTPIRLLIVAAVVVFGGTVAVAGDFHTGLNLLCSDCHVMHFSQTHGYDPDGGNLPIVPLGSSPQHYLLRDDINAICLTCHDGKAWAPDVLEANTLGQALVRQAGALNKNDAAPYFEETGHTLDSVASPPGETAAWSNDDGLDCVDCHHPHGYGGPTPNPYRNLAGTIGGFTGSVTYVNGTNNLTFDVFQRVPLTYEVADMDLNDPNDGTTGEVAFSKWCGNCHGEFHGLPGDADIGGAGGDEFIRHPSADVDIGALGGGHSSMDVYQLGESGTKTTFVKVASPGGVWPTNGSQWAPAVVPDDLTPTCISCHKGHGNRNAFGLIYMGETGTVTEEGSDSHNTAMAGTYFDLCKQCHVQGG